MSFPKYPAYKDSGVEWLGEVPTHWTVSSIKHFADLITGITPPSDDQSNYADDGWPWVRPEDLTESGEVVRASRFLTEKGRNFCRNVKAGSTLICCIGTIGKAGFVDRDVCTNQQITAVVPKSRKRYFFYSASALKQAFDLSATGNVLRILNSDRLGRIETTIPPKKEAKSIAHFLDYETAKIDALIEEQQRLIELLKEKRQAVISQAVTKGLDPDVPMKDSGVEWLGEVPEHWEIAPLKLIAQLNPTKSEFVSRKSLSCSFVPMEKLKTDQIQLDETRVIEDVFDGYTSFRNGDVLLAKVTPCFENRNIALAQNLTNGIGFGSTEIFVLRPTRVLGRFLFYRLLDDMLVNYWTSEMTGAGGLKRVPSSVVENYAIASPAKDEQRIIVSYLDKKNKNFNKLMAEAIELINLLKERRSALISAAVTGKIDVRGWRPNESISHLCDQEIDPSLVSL